MKLVYFAWVREAIGVGEETVTVPDGVATVGGVLSFLRERGEAHVRALTNESRLRFAVNQEHATLDSPVGPDDEVAIFPPVTGG